MQYRSGKQCRERYINQLDPLIKKTMWTYEEDAIIIRLHNQYGKKWSKFMDQLPGRSDNAIKNRYHIISRDNYSDHYQQHSQQKRSLEPDPEIKQEDERDEDDGSSSPESDEVRLERFRAAREVLDRQIDALVQKRKHPKTSPKEEDGPLNSFHKALKLRPEHDPVLDSLLLLRRGDSLGQLPLQTSKSHDSDSSSSRDRDPLLLLKEVADEHHHHSPLPSVEVDINKCPFMSGNRIQRQKNYQT